MVQLAAAEAANLLLACYQQKVSHRVCVGIACSQSAAAAACAVLKRRLYYQCVTAAYGTQFAGTTMLLSVPCCAGWQCAARQGVAEWQVSQLRWRQWQRHSWARSMAACSSCQGLAAEAAGGRNNAAGGHEAARWASSCICAGYGGTHVAAPPRLSRLPQ